MDHRGRDRARPQQSPRPHPADRLAEARRCSLGDPGKNPRCGDFVETCIRISLPDEPLPGVLRTNPNRARNWTRFCQAVHPVIGAVRICERGSGGHAGVAVGQHDPHFFVFGGNRSDAVTIARIAKSRLPGARWPVRYPPRQQRRRP